ncbi:MAG: HSP20 family protein [Polaribacter sp.]|jgi:HSP20 family protein
MHLIKRSNRPAPTFAKILDTFLSDDLFPTPSKGATLWNNTMPAVNIKESADQYELEIAAPGMEKSDFQINIDQDVLTISSEKKTKTEEGDKFTRREFSYGSFKRSFDLPETVDASKIAANYHNGVLAILIPKREEAKPQPVRKIEIN